MGGCGKWGLIVSLTRAPEEISIYDSDDDEATNIKQDIFRHTKRDQRSRGVEEYKEDGWK